MLSMQLSQKCSTLAVCFNSALGSSALYFCFSLLLCTVALYHCWRLSCLLALKQWGVLRKIQQTPTLHHTAATAEQALVLQVYLWDQRGGSAPRTKLGMGSGFSINSLQLSEDANMLLVGTQTGDVSPRRHFAFQETFMHAMRHCVCLLPQWYHEVKQSCLQQHWLYGVVCYHVSLTH